MPKRREHLSAGSWSRSRRRSRWRHLHGWDGHAKDGHSKGWHGSKPGGWGMPPPPRKRWGLRRRLNFAFAFVALGAVALTTFLTLGAVFDAQQELFGTAVPGANASASGRYDWHSWSEQFAPARQAFQQITRSAFFAGLLSFFIASITAALITRALTRPLKALTDGARRLGAGERGLQLRVPRSRDELRTLTEAFNGLATGLERQEAWRRNLVADIAHDLRTPLSVMRSELEALQDGVVPLDDAALARLHGEVLTLAKLVTNLRELSLAEGGVLTLRLTEQPLKPFLARFCESFGARASEAGVKLELLPVPLTLSASFDTDQLTRLLGNLVGNALNYASPGTVELGAARSETGVTLWVRDRGPGLPAEPDKLFERFFQGDASRTRPSTGEKGSGLGLSIARAIAQAHGGTLTAANHPGGGAVFTLALPQVQATPS